MGRYLFYGSMAVALGLAGWFYSQGQSWPDSLDPLALFLFGLAGLGYALKARDDGELGAGPGKVRRDKTPTAFRVGVYLTFAGAAALVLGALYMLVT